MSNILRYKEELFDKPPQHICYCFLEKPKKLLDGIPNVHTHEGLPTQDDIEAWVDEYGGDLCIVFDDLGSDLFSSDEGRDLLTKWVHHKSLFVIVVSHQLFGKEKHSRLASLQFHYYVFTRSCRDQLTYVRYVRM